MTTPPGWVMAVVASGGVTAAGRALRFSPAGALAAGILAASLLAAHDAPRLTLALALGAALVVLASSHGRLSTPWRWLALEVAVALVPLAVGVRAHVSGVVLSDSLLTVVWIAVVVHGFRRLGGQHNLVAAAGALMGLATLLLGALAGQPGVSTLSAGVVASSAAAPALARRRLSPGLGDAGSALLGLTAAALAIAVSPSVPAPESFGVPVVLLAVPLTAAISSRLEPRHGLALAATAMTTVLAVLAGRGVIPVVAALAVAALSVFVGVAALGARPASRPPAGPSPAKWLLALAIAAAAAVVPGVIALLTARAPARQAASLARSALEQATTADAASTAAAFGEARQLFRQAGSRLAFPGASLSLAVPAMATNVDAARALVSLGGQLSEAGMHLATASESLRVRHGGVELTGLSELQPVLARASAVASRSRERLRSLNQELLAGPLRDAVEQLDDRLDGDVRSLRLAADGARHLPAILGGEEPRHYFLAFQSNGELRGTGGFIGAWGEIEATAGRLRLTRYARLGELNAGGVRPRQVTLPDGFRTQWGVFDVQQFWEGVNASPDFPTTARLITQLYPQSGGRPIDGVVAVDAPGLAALLEITGPVSVPGWPEPISSSNVVDVTLRTSAERFASDDERHEFLADVVRYVVEGFTASADGASARAVVHALGSAALGNHLLVYLTRPEEQALAQAAEVEGEVPPLLGDSLLVVNQNVAGNKTDLFLHRRIVYRATLRPVGNHVEVAGGLEVNLRNDAPSSGLPEGVIGPYDDRFAPGENRSLVAVYTALDATSVEHEGGTGETRARDLGRWVHSSTISIPSGQTRTVKLSLAGRVHATDEGWYRLEVLHQTSMIPDHLEVVLDVPRPWRIEAAEGASTWDPHRAVLRRDLDRQATVALRLGTDGDSSAWSRLWDPSFGADAGSGGSLPRGLTYGGVGVAGVALWRRRQGMSRTHWAGTG